MHPSNSIRFFTMAILTICPALASAESDSAKQRMFAFNSDGGAAAIAHIKGEVTREIVCHELDELEETAVTDFFWCPIVGGNVFIYPTQVGERMGDNIRDWDKVHPYYREQGRAMSDNLRQLIERGDDPIKMLSARAKKHGIRFWLTCRMNEIHEDDDRFMVVRSLFKEKHPELLHGENYHPEAVYASKKGYSYAWDYGKAPVREHFLALFHEWLQYEIDGIELDFCRSPCLFPPGKEQEGMPLLTDFVTKLRAAARETAKHRDHEIKLAIRVPPSLDRCHAAGIDVKTWIDLGLVDVVTPMDRGYFDPEPDLPEFVALATPKGVVVLGGIEPKVRGYEQSNRQTFAAVASFVRSGAGGIYLFNYDCHRQQASSSRFGGVLKPYTPDEASFLKDALNPDAVRNHDKQYLISQATNGRLAGEGGDRPLRRRLPVGELRTFFMTIGDDLQEAASEKRLRSSRLVIKLKDCIPKADELTLRINGRVVALTESQFETQRDLIAITLAAPPMRLGENTIKLGLKPTSEQRGLIHSIDLNVEYTTSADQPEKATGSAAKPIDVGTRKQLFIDKKLVESSRDIRFTMNPPQRDGKVLLVADQPWEKRGHISVYSSVLKEKDRVRVWYDLVEITGDGPYDHERRVGYAESKDGIHFVKPKLGLHEVEGSTANNVVMPTTIGGCAVWIDPKALPGDRYKTQAKVYPSGEFHMHSSRDGLRWKLFSKLHPGPGGHDTQSIVFWDSNVNRYALFTRYWAHRGDAKRRYRTVRRLETDDLKTKWKNQTIAMAPDEVDRATHKMSAEQSPVDYYGACVFPYEEAPDVTIMLAQTYWHWRPRDPLKGLGPASFDVRLAVSRDGKTFRRIGERKPFMANGREDQFDSRYVWVMPNPIRMGDELWIYYAGSNRDHDGNIDPGAPGGKHLAGIGRAVLRLDGFVSADADFRGGRLTTPLIRFSGERLELNVETSGGGSVEVVLLDEQGEPIEGYFKADSRPINGNSVRMPVRWNTTDDVSKLAGRPVRLRFHMQDCKLYSFQFRPRRG